MARSPVYSRQCPHGCAEAGRAQPTADTARQGSVAGGTRTSRAYPSDLSLRRRGWQAQPVDRRTRACRYCVGRRHRRAISSSPERSTVKVVFQVQVCRNRCSNDGDSEIWSGRQSSTCFDLSQQFRRSLHFTEFLRPKKGQARERLVTWFMFRAVSPIAML
jgi:hypothetical protein